MTHKPPSQAFLALVFAGALLLSFGFVDLRSMSLQGEVSQLEQQVEHEKTRGARLAEGRYYLDLKYRLQVLTLTVRQLIDNRASAAAPFITAAGKVLSRTTDVSIETLEYSGGHMKLHGSAQSADAAANFRSALESSGNLSCSPLPAPSQDTSGNGTSLELDCVPVPAKPAAPVTSKAAARPSGS